jgi:predicted permease
MKRRAFHLGLGRGHLARDVDDEIAFHLETKVQRLVASGLSPEAARARALSEFGDTGRVRDDCIHEDQLKERTMQRVNALDDLRQDVTYALRTMRRSPLFTAIVVLTLGLGIAANTSIFTLVNAVMLRPLPVDAPGELVAIGDQRRTGSLSTGAPKVDLVSYQLYKDTRAGNSTLSDLMASGRAPFYMMRQTRDETDSPGVRSRFVSGNYFRVLGVPAFLGRTFDGSEDENIGASPHVVISYSLWRRRFAADTGVIGKRILISSAGYPMSVIGVAPPWFNGEIVGSTIEMWIPLTMQEALQPTQKMLDRRDASWLLLMGRRKPGVSLEQVRAQLTPVIRRSILDHPVPGETFDSTRALPIASGARGFSAVRGSYAKPLKTLMAGVILLLLIICANVANLLLARALARSREMGVRIAIGAGRTRLMRQLLTESLLLGVFGGAVGLTGALWGSRLLLKLAADGGSTLPLDIGLDVPILLFTGSVAVAAVILFGFVPALRSSRVDLATAMRATTGAVVTGGMTARGQRMPLGRVLIGMQVALSLVLLVGASLLVRNLRSIQSADAGLARDRLLQVDLGGVPLGYTQDRLIQLANDAAARLKAIPGVEAVSYSDNGIFWGSEATSTIMVPGFTGRDMDDSSTHTDIVGPGYIRGIGARILRGRDIEPQDVRGTANVAVANEAMVKHFFANRDPIGQTIHLDSATAVTIVGVAANVKDHSLVEEVGPRMYMSYGQHPDGFAGSAHMLLRTKGDPERLTPQVRKTIEGIDARFKNTSVNTVANLMRDSISEERLLTRLAAAFGAMALLLAAIGLYGVMTYAVTRRTAEIGLRVALGAQRGDVIGMVLADAMTLVGAGVIVGLPASLAAGQLLKAQLSGITAADPLAITVAVGVMAASAAAAALAPALRASRVAPLQSLRQE